MPTYSEGGFILKTKEILVKVMLENKILNKKKNSFKSCKISTFNFCFLGSVILHKLGTADSSDQGNFGLIRQRNINNILNES